MELDKMFSEVFSRYLTGYALSKAIMEDYAIVIAKIEGTSEEQIKDRVMARTNEIFNEVMERQKQKFEEIKGEASKKRI